LISKLKNWVLENYDSCNELDGRLALNVSISIPSSSDFVFNDNLFEDFKEDLDIVFLEDDWVNEINKNYLKFLSFSQIECYSFETSSSKSEVINLESSDSLSGKLVLINCKPSFSGKIIVVKKGKGMFQDELRVFVDEGSNVDFVFLNDLGESSSSFSYHNFKVKKNSKLNFKNFSLGSKFSFSKVNVIQYGFSEVNVSSLIYSQENTQKLIDVKINQIGNENKSNVDIKGLTEDSAKTIASSNINISGDSEGGEAFESLEILNLSEYSESNLMPFLEIFNPNVTCSHKAVIELLDDEKLFYLQSRGLRKEEARSLVISSFLNSFLNDLALEINDSVLNYFKAFISEGDDE